jgi:DNA-binding CsgD family transcriptional regulator
VHEQAVVGRRPELAALAALLTRLPEGPAALLLTGSAGMGKTTVWREGVRIAEREGCLVLSARPTGAEARYSFAGLSDLLAPLGREHFPRLPAVQRRALDVALLRGEEDGARADARAVATGLLTLLRELAARQPVLVAVDDAQWLDSPTAAALRFALRRLAPAPVGVLATLRTDGLRAPALVDELESPRRTEVELEPLTVAAIHEIVRRELGRSLPRPTIVKVTAAIEGNPFYALEMARELVRLDRASTDGVLPIPDEARSLVGARVGRLPRRTRDALVVAACLSVPTTALVDEAALAPAEAAGVVRIEPDRRIRFAHPLLASAVYESVPTATRRAVHRELAVRLDDPEERARHLAFGSERVDDAVAGALEEASWIAYRRGAPGAAAELMELALGRAGDPGGAEPFGRLLAAAGFHFDTGDLARATGLAQRARAAASSDLERARALRLLGQLSGRRSGFAEALGLALEALEAARDDGPLRAGVELDVAFYATGLGDFAGARPHARAAVAAAGELGDDRALASPLAVRTMVEFLSGNGLAEQDLARAVDLEGPGDPAPVFMRPRFIRGLLLLWTGRLDESVAALDDVREGALDRGQESEAPLVFLYLVWACLWQGDLERAGRYAEESRETAQLLGDPVATALALSAAVLVHAHDGRVAEARAETAEALSLFDRLQWRAGMIWPLWGLGFLELSLGNVTAVDAALGPLAPLLAELGPTDPVLAVFLPDQIEALIELGRGDEARLLLDGFEERARTVDRPWALAAAARCRGLLGASGGDLQAALAHLDDALAQHDRVAMPLERARTLLVLGRVLRRSRKRQQARRALQEALAVFERTGTSLWAERARGELERLGLASSGEDDLTPTERRIAELAASGLSNREIADRAFVSVKTVEARLTRAYRKLGVRSRVQLADALAVRPHANA